MTSTGSKLQQWITVVIFNTDVAVVHSCGGHGESHIGERLVISRPFLTDSRTVASYFCWSFFSKSFGPPTRQTTVQNTAGSWTWKFVAVSNEPWGFGKALAIDNTSLTMGEPAENCDVYQKIPLPPHHACMEDEVAHRHRTAEKNAYKYGLNSRPIQNEFYSSSQWAWLMGNINRGNHHVYDFPGINPGIESFPINFKVRFSTNPPDCRRMPSWWCGS